MSTVEQQVKAIVAEQLGVKAEQVTNDASFVDDLGADSLDTVELVMALEEEFEIEIPDEDAEKITTVHQAIDYINKRRVVVTGLGVVSPVGSTVDSAWAAVLRGESGIGPLTRFDVSAFPVRFGGEVRGFDVAQYITPKEARRMDDFMHYGVAAGVQAVSDSGIDFSKTDPTRCGAVCGAGIGGLGTIEAEYGEYLKAMSPRKISPFFVPATIINMIAGHLSIRYGLRGPNLGVVTGCTPSTH